MTIYGTDRYEVLGMPPPDPGKSCEGECEGIGVVPIYAGEADPDYRALWEVAEREQPSADGWHFVMCKTCKGTGVRS